MKTADVIIIGSGAAGLFNALFLPQDYKVIVITKKTVEESDSFLAQGGISALKNPEDYEARANLMWASTLALNGLTGAGKGQTWSCHPIEHELSAYYDITHGTGLAILTPRWMRYILSDKTVSKFADYGVNVFALNPDEDPYKIANKAIDLTEEFFKKIGIPMHLSELGIGTEKFDEISQKLDRKFDDAYIPMTPQDVKKILEMCL